METLEGANGSPPLKEAEKPYIKEATTLGGAELLVPEVPAKPKRWKKVYKRIQPRKVRPKCVCGQDLSYRYHSRTKHDKIMGTYQEPVVAPPWELVEDLANRLAHDESNPKIAQAVHLIRTAARMLKGDSQ